MDKKKFTPILVSIAATAGLLNIILPWWSIGLAAAGVTIFFRLRPGWAFLTGFLSIALLWSVTAMTKDVSNEHILSTKMAELFHLPNSFTFLAVSVLVGALVGGLSAWSAALLAQVFRKPV